MATREENKHFWHWIIVVLLGVTLLFQIKLYRGQQQLKSMVSEGILQLKEKMAEKPAIDNSPTKKDDKMMKR